MVYRPPGSAAMSATVRVPCTDSVGESKAPSTAVMVWVTMPVM
jgi:hypothetical protein